MRVDDVLGFLRTMERAIVAALGRDRASRPARARTRAATTPASGSRTARSPRSACTSPAASPPTASRSTSTTTWSRSTWVVACGLPSVRMTSVARGGLAPTASPASASAWPTASREAFGRRQRLSPPSALGVGAPSRSVRWTRERDRRCASTRRAPAPTPAGWTSRRCSATDARRSAGASRRGSRSRPRAAPSTAS